MIKVPAKVRPPQPPAHSHRRTRTRTHRAAPRRVKPHRATPRRVKPHRAVARASKPRGAARPPAHCPPRVQVQLYREGESGYDAFVVASGQVRKVPYYTASHKNSHTTPYSNKVREDLRQRK